MTPLRDYPRRLLQAGFNHWLHIARLESMIGWNQLGVDAWCRLHSPKLLIKILATYPTSIFTQPFLLILPLHLPPQRRRLSPRLISKLRGRRRLYRLPQSALEIDTHVYSGDHLPIGRTNGRVNYLTTRVYRGGNKGLYVVARNFFLLLLNCSSAWPCLGPA